ncbi:hypothetical protein T637_09730 [Enterobacter hormaechei subsp. hoffmannii]|uniref:hypothetical protein n=1 Tax=Enterobacter hormaechei TaxID=158836 RepID=UPI0006277C14|nr:hypothetical protein [Enterobacter hormaechei]KKJ32125.1 hypothetical protein T637_09730 [Enterobacter hormaechei subsp. hoffmannii]
MSNIDKQALTAESARESGNILLIVAARMASRELFTPLHYVSELPQKVVSMRVFREALERSEETLQREVCKIVDGHDRMQKKLKEAEAKLEAAEKRIAELEAREVKPVAWMRSANVTSFMSRFTTNENYAVEQWGDDAVALYSLPVDYIPACFTDERNLMHINERGRETSLIWSEQNSDSDDIQLFRIAAAGNGKGE